MSNAAFLAADAQIFAKLLRRGLADSAILTVGGNDTPCTVIIDRDVQQIGSEGQVIGPRDTATFLLSEVTPVRNATLTVGADVRKLSQRTGGDESIQVWTIE